MVKISLHTFWNNVRLHDNLEKVAKIFAPFDQTNMEFSSVAEARVHMLEKMIPAEQEAAEINHCRNLLGIASYYLKINTLMAQTLGDKTEWLEKGAAPVEVRKRYTMDRANLSRSYARQKMCHPTTRDFICYCQS